MNDALPYEWKSHQLDQADLDPEFLDAVRAASPAAWERLVEPLGPRVHRLRVLRAEACARLSDEVQELERSCASRGIELARPNSMNEYGVILDDVGYGDMLQTLTTTYLRPLAAYLHPDLGGASLDAHHGFLVDYERGKDEDLGFHVDDSELTLNVCLENSASGSELYFRGARCMPHRQTRSLASEEFELTHEPGVAILHIGKERHGVHPLRRGRRRNLILWCRSTSYRAGLTSQAPCPAWCGARNSF